MIIQASEDQVDSCKMFIAAVPKSHIFLSSVLANSDTRHKIWLALRVLSAFARRAFRNMPLRGRTALQSVAVNSVGNVLRLPNKGGGFVDGVAENP